MSVKRTESNIYKRNYKSNHEIGATGKRKKFKLS